MKKIFILFILISQIAIAQQKQMSLEDAVLGRFTYLRPTSLKSVAWKSDDVFTFVKDKTLWAESVKKGDKESVFTTDELQELIGSKLSGFPRYSWLNKIEILIQTKNSFIVLNSEQKKIQYKIELPKNAKNSVFNEAGKFVSFTQNDDLFVTSANGKIIQIIFG